MNKITEQPPTDFNMFLHSEPEIWHEDFETFEVKNGSDLIDLINENFSSVEAINNFKDIVAEYYYPLKQFYKDKFSDNSWLQIELTKPCFAPQSEPPVPEDVLGTEQHIGCFFVMGSCDKFVSKHEKNLIVCLLLDPETRQFTKAFTDPKPDISIKNKMN